MKPVIAITPLYDQQSDRYFIRGGYTDSIEKAGGIPLILPFTQDLSLLESYLPLIDGFVFAGGHDIEPLRYAKEDKGYSGSTIPARDEMELFLYDYLIKNDLPALGICRGIQMFNVAGGGDLFQDLSKERESSMTHFVSSKKGQGIPSEEDNRHLIEIDPKSDLYRLLHTKSLEVNSFHHQGVRTLADGYEVMAKAADGTIEAISRKGSSWLWGVQWHPELLYADEPAHFALFQELVRQAAIRKEARNR